MRILVVDDDRSIRRSMEKFLGALGYETVTAEDGAAALEALDRDAPDAVLLDLGLPGLDGLEVLARIHSRENPPPVLVVSARDDMHSTVTAMQRGAWDYLVKPIDIERIKISLRRALESRELTQRLDTLVETIAREHTVGNILGRSAPMREVFKAIGRLSTSSTTVLITGETGTGKELVARAIHYAGESRDQPFVAVNCTAFARDLLESELFGHAKGAFTGAIGDKSGRFQLAGSGTLFLDEVGELPLDIQVKLLRVLQERTFERVGDPRPVPLKARVLAATHRDLAQMVRDGTFREDLYFRLKVVEVQLPPLRQRRDDIPLLVEGLLARITREQHKKIRYVARDALDVLSRHRWPGNVRELENALIHAVLHTQGEVLEVASLPVALDETPDEPADDEPGDATEGADAHSNTAVESKAFMTLREVEQRHVTAVLQATAWNKRRSCAILGITRPTLDRKIRDFGLERPARPGSA